MLGNQPKDASKSTYFDLYGALVKITPIPSSARTFLNIRWLRNLLNILHKKVSVEIIITNTEQLEKGWPLLLKQTPKFLELKVSKKDGEGLGLSSRQFKLGPFPPTLSDLSLSGVPLGPFLQLTTLTNFTYEGSFALHIDSLLEFLEDNRSLERVKLVIKFASPEFRQSQRQSPIGTTLQCLIIKSSQPEDIKALTSARIPLKSTEHANLFIIPCGPNAISGPFLSDIVATHFRDRKRPTSMFYGCGWAIRFSTGREGPGLVIASDKTEEASFSPTLENIRELPSLGNIRELGLYRYQDNEQFDPSQFPMLQSLTIFSGTNLLQKLSKLRSSPQSSPNLKHIIFAKCDGPPEYHKELEEFIRSCGDIYPQWVPPLA